MAHELRERNKQLILLLDKLQDLKSRHKHASAPMLELELINMRKQITDLLHYKAKAALQYCRKLEYESRDKCGKLLAKSVRELKLTTYIPQLISPVGLKMVLPKQITQEFRQFYSSLYNLTNNTHSQADIDEFIRPSQLPTLPAVIGADLDAPITLEEIRQVIGKMQSGKTP